MIKIQRIKALHIKLEEARTFFNFKEITEHMGHCTAKIQK